MPSSTKKDVFTNPHLMQDGHTIKAAGRENKPHVGIFGRCNSGKSTLLNFLTEQDAAVVSPVAGTTTDCVRRGYEILGFGPVVFIDTPGTDDTTAIAGSRLTRTEEAMAETDLGIIVYTEWAEGEKALAGKLKDMGIPLVLIENRIGGNSLEESAIRDERPGPVLAFDIEHAQAEERGKVLKAVARMLPESSYRQPSMFGDRIKRGEHVLLVCPIDSEAPAGRLILPQVQAIRQLLDAGAVATVIQPAAIPVVLRSGPRPALVVADSQVLKETETAFYGICDVTSFSILLAGMKGDPGIYERGLEAIDRLQDGNIVLITENCLHQSSCEDIGREKIPAWLREYTGCTLRFEFVSGIKPLPADLSRYALIIQCGGCMATRTLVHNRIRQACAAGVPITNYGMAIRKIRK